MELSETHWLLSPVIGEVRNMEAIIICDPVDKTHPLSYSIKQKDKDKDRSISKYINKSFEITELSGLQPRHAKGIPMDDAMQAKLRLPIRVIIKFPNEGRFRIKWIQEDLVIFEHEILITNKPDKMIFVSCDLLEADVNPSMWTIMNKEISSDKHTSIIHLGDQAYMDGVFKHGVKLVRKHGKSNEIKARICKEFRDRYYETWMPHRKILANVSNYCIWDDHEIKNNMTLDNDDVTDEEQYVRSIAVDAYKQCQESLQLTFNNIITDHSWIKRMGSNNEILLMTIERTSRLIRVSEFFPIISTENNKIPIRKLILCFSSAPIPNPQGGYAFIYRTLTGDQGTFETSKFWPSSDLIELYSCIFNWMEQNDGAEVLLVGGDLHFGTHGVVSRKQKKFNVVISSPITNEPTADRYLASKGMKGVHMITDNDDNGQIIFTTISSKARRCYSVVDISISPITVTMNYSKEKIPNNPVLYAKTLISFI